jgi:inorganic triphosphatase YgiF
MAQEIELKFYVHPDSVETLRNHLHSLTDDRVAPTQLLNIYYETADNWLRRHDMGLRIRGFDGQYEMTMKIAGRVVGGLHQRPEYNIALDKPELDLARFPQEVWPDGALPEISRRRHSRSSAPISTGRNGWLTSVKAVLRLGWTWVKLKPASWLSLSVSLSLNC